MVAGLHIHTILRSLRNHGTQLGKRGSSNHFDGFTEAWIEETWPAQSISDLMGLVYEDEV